MKDISFHQVKLTGGFWKEKQDLIRDVTIYSVYKQFADTGRIEAFRCDWTKGKPHQPHFYWDSDVAKWIESVAYLTREKREPALEQLADAIIDDVAAHQLPDGYFNTYYQTVEPRHRFVNRENHELYCAGHLMEAAVAYYEATGKDRLLRCMEKYADLIYKVFIEDQSAAFHTPGHEEIELALESLYRVTGNRKYITMQEFFLNERGKHPLEKDLQKQSHLPVREQHEAVGHSVRAAYLYSAMADYAIRTGDAAMREACLALFQDIYDKKMYITGGIGANQMEAFSDAYDLPNAHAYSETCAGIGLVFFAHRMQRLDIGNPVYADVIERILYNAALSGLSLDGKKFFYVNPLEIPAPEDKIPGVSYPITQRVEVFDCSCCPPNLTRFIPKISGLIYLTEGDTIYVNQYMEGEAEFDGCKIQQKTNYPYDGHVEVTYYGSPKTLKFRVPGWCDRFQGRVERGYYTVQATDGMVIALDFPMEAHQILCDSRVEENRGKLAVSYGPTIFCMESVDNGHLIRDIRIPFPAHFIYEARPEDGRMTLTCDAYRAVHASALYTHYTPCQAVFLPYRVFANRGESEMAVWIERADL